VQSKFTNLGQGFQICGENWSSVHRSHAQWLQMHCQCYPIAVIITHNSRMDMHGIFRLGGGDDHVTYNNF